MKKFIFWPVDSEEKRARTLKQFIEAADKLTIKPVRRNQADTIPHLGTLLDAASGAGKKLTITMRKSVRRKFSFNFSITLSPNLPLTEQRRRIATLIHVIVAISGEQSLPRFAKASHIGLPTLRRHARPHLSSSVARDAPQLPNMGTLLDAAAYSKAEVILALT